MESHKEDEHRTVLGGSRFLLDCRTGVPTQSGVIGVQDAV